MKKVRLFAVAAAMGMFAATVNAAAPVATKDVYTATWGTMDEIVRAEIGGKVILPTLNVSIEKQVRSTDKKFASSASGDFGVGSLNAGCYEGFTSKLGKDTNGDGISDYPVLSWGEGHTVANPVNPNWFYDDAKFFPTNNTALFYLGMTGNGLGARFLEPNSKGKDAYIVASTHTWVENTAAGVDAFIKGLVDAGTISEIKDASDYVIGYKVSENSTTYVDAKKKIVDKKSYDVLKTTDGSKRREDFAKDALMEFLSGTYISSGATVLDTVTVTYKSTTAEMEAIAPYKASVVVAGVAGDVTIEANDVVITSEYRGKTYVEKVLKSTDTLSAADQAIYDKYVVAARISIIGEDKLGFYRVNSVKPAAFGNSPAFTFVWNETDANFAKQEAAPAAPVAKAYDAHEAQGYVGGLYKVDTVDNTSDKIVIDFGMGNYGMLAYDELDVRSKTMTFKVPGSTAKITVPAVELNREWYPAVANAADLATFVAKMANITKASDSFVENLTSGGKRTWANGTVDAAYIPQNNLDHYKAQQCSYVVSKEAVAATDYTVTSNASTIDTTKAGVHTLTLTVKLGETVATTKDVKVVIAPKYVREYKNGRVVSLKAYHLNSNLYSHSTFDYAKKSTTTVFYAQDGVTAVETVTSAIK